MTTSRDTITYSSHTAILMGVALLAVVAYVYFLNMSVVHVVLQKEALADMQDVRNDIALLEAEYIAAQHAIAARMATVDGLAAERDKLFVSRTVEADLVLNQ